ncbi:hypothetical protein MY3296_009920 [Beauveria thailandica]
MRIVAAQSQCMRHRRSQRATWTGGQVFTAKYVISAVPLNVLSSVAFNPPFLIYGFGDCETPAGNTHVVAFGGQHKHFHPEDDINRTISEFHGFTPMQVERGVFHNWCRDEFAKGAWFFPAPGVLASHFDELRARQGNIFFASSNWASGWRSFIDGAIEEGTRAAASVRADLIGQSKN